MPVEPDRNDRIMRFRPGQPLRDRAVFERTIRDALAHVPVRLVCVLQGPGVGTAREVARYLRWARDLGVRDVVFRELSRLGEGYVPNRTLRTVERDRVPIEGLLQDVRSASDLGRALTPVEATAGYYYWNVRFRWERELDVTFETSDYGEMKSRHRSGQIHKLVFPRERPPVRGLGPRPGGPPPGPELRPWASPRAERALVAAGLRAVVMGSVAVERLAPGALDRPPADLDLALPFDGAELDRWARTMEAEGFEVRSWTEVVHPPLDLSALEGRFYLRASRTRGGDRRRDLRAGGARVPGRLAGPGSRPGRRSRRDGPRARPRARRGPRDRPRPGSPRPPRPPGGHRIDYALTRVPAAALPPGAGETPGPQEPPRCRRPPRLPPGCGSRSVPGSASASSRGSRTASPPGAWTSSARWGWRGASRSSGSRPRRRGPGPTSWSPRSSPTWRSAGPRWSAGLVPGPPRPPPRPAAGGDDP